jgi:hypothetical protein
LACPLPEGDLAIGASIEEAIQKALREAEKKQIQGKDVTPFVLARVSQLSGNESLRLSQLFLNLNFPFFEMKNNQCFPFPYSLFLAFFRHSPFGEQCPNCSPFGTPLFGSGQKCC